MILTFQLVCLIIGLLLVITAQFLYEAEEKAIQNSLVDLWIKIDDLTKTRFNSIAKGLILRSFKVSNHFYSKAIFGGKVLSIEFFNSSISYSLGGLFLFFFATDVLSSFECACGNYPKYSFFYLFFGIVTVNYITKNTFLRYFVAIIFIVIFILFIVSTFTIRQNTITNANGNYIYILYASVFLFGLFGDILYYYFNKWFQRLYLDNIKRIQFFKILLNIFSIILLTIVIPAWINALFAQKLSISNFQDFRANFIRFTSIFMSINIFNVIPVFGIFIAPILVFSGKISLIILSRIVYRVQKTKLKTAKVIQVLTGLLIMIIPKLDKQLIYILLSYF